MNRVIRRNGLALAMLMMFFALPALNCGASAASCSSDIGDPGATCDVALKAQGANIAVLDALARKYAKGAGLGDLLRGERCLVAAAATGGSVWLGKSSNPKYCGNDPARDWLESEDRTIRPALLAWMLTDPDANRRLTRKGISIGGAVVKGSLDLRYAILPVLKLKNCQLGTIQLGDAVARTIDLTGSRIALLDGTRLHVQGDLELRAVLASGEVDLTEAAVDGSLHVGDAHLSNPGDSLILASTKIGGSALFGGTYSVGMIRVTRVTIDGDLNFSSVVFSDVACNGLKAGYAKVKGNFWWAPSGIGKHTELVLVGASVGTFHNSDVKGWPSKNCLFLDGFEFSQLDPESLADGSKQKKWLDLQPDRAHDVQYSTNSNDLCDTYKAKDSGKANGSGQLQAQYPNSQPFKELATVLQNSGKEDDATALRIDEAQEDLEADETAQPGSPRTWVLWVWGKVARFGYDPLNTIRFIVAFVILGWLIFWFGFYAGLIVPTDKEAFVEYVNRYDSSKERRPPVYYQLFNSFFYSLETFLPLVDLFQVKNWLPNPQREPQLTSRLVRWYLWIHIIAGWFFATALLAGLSGLFHK